MRKFKRDIIREFLRRLKVYYKRNIRSIKRHIREVSEI